MRPFCYIDGLHRSPRVWIDTASGNIATVAVVADVRKRQENAINRRSKLHRMMHGYGKHLQWRDNDFGGTLEGAKTGNVEHQLDMMTERSQDMN